MARHKFWMVLGEGTPTFRHDSKASAVQEAERLARMLPCTEFFVLESIGVCKKTDISWEATDATTITDDDAIPF